MRLIKIEKLHFISLCLVFLSVFLSCATDKSTTVIADVADPKTPPLWVYETKQFYPEKDWVAAVDYSGERRDAETAAVISLAKIFKVDVNGVTTAVQNINQNITELDNTFTQDNNLRQQFDFATDVSGLYNIQKDFWTKFDGTVFVCARMNKAEGIKTYSKLINDNIEVINKLIGQAEEKKATFDAYQYLAFAYNLSLVTDNYINILTVLTPNPENYFSKAYINASAMQTLMYNELSTVVINVRVRNDEANRISKAFAAVFSERGFRTAVNDKDASYVMDVNFSLEDVDLKNNNNLYVRYIITSSLKAKDGKEVLTFSANDRAGHTTRTEATQRAIRDAEKAITETNFAKEFDIFLTQLGKPKV